MNEFKNSQRLSLAILTFLMVTLAGCATSVSIDPTRTSMMTVHVVAPEKLDGQAVTEAKRCDFKNGPITEEMKAIYLKDPAKPYIDGVCVQDPRREVVNTQPSWANQASLGFVNAGSAGLFSWGVQSFLQRDQQQHCLKIGGCGGTSIVNNNNGEAISNAGSQAIVEGVSTVVKVTTPAAPASCGKGCLSGK